MSDVAVYVIGNISYTVCCYVLYSDAILGIKWKEWKGEVQIGECKLTKCSFALFIDRDVHLLLIKLFTEVIKSTDTTLHIHKFFLLTV
jgi:hypothetical protein